MLNNINFVIKYRFSLNDFWLGVYWEYNTNLIPLYDWQFDCFICIIPFFPFHIILKKIWIKPPEKIWRHRFESQLMQFTPSYKDFIEASKNKNE